MTRYNNAFTVHLDKAGWNLFASKQPLNDENTRGDILFDRADPTFVKQHMFVPTQAQYESVEDLLYKYVGVRLWLHNHKDLRIPLPVVRKNADGSEDRADFSKLHYNMKDIWSEKDAQVGMQYTELHEDWKSKHKTPFPVPDWNERLNKGNQFHQLRTHLPQIKDAYARSPTASPERGSPLDDPRTHNEAFEAQNRSLSIDPPTGKEAELVKLQTEIQKLQNDSLEQLPARNMFKKDGKNPSLSVVYRALWELWEGGKYPSPEVSSAAKEYIAVYEHTLGLVQKRDSLMKEIKQDEAQRNAPKPPAPKPPSKPVTPVRRPSPAPSIAPSITSSVSSPGRRRRRRRIVHPMPVAPMQQIIQEQEADAVAIEDPDPGGKGARPFCPGDSKPGCRARWGRRRVRHTGPHGVRRRYHPTH